MTGIPQRAVNCEWNGDWQLTTHSGQSKVTEITSKSAVRLFASAEFSAYVLQLTEEQLYLHTVLFALGQLHILLLAHH